MKEKSLIVYISNRGYAEKVMDFARGLGARGGTVISGKSSISDEDEKFFKITIHPEKDVLLIVCLDKEKDKIMKSIYQKFGSNSAAEGIVFALQVDRLVGVELK